MPLDLTPEERKEFVSEVAAEAKTVISAEVKTETKASIDKINTSIADQFTKLKEGKSTEADFMEFKTKADKRLDEIETKMSRVPVAGQPAPENELSIEHKALMTFLRKDISGVGPDERKALVSSDDTAGGYLVSPEISNELLKTITEFSPIRSIARVRPTSKNEIWVRKRTGQFAARHVGETETRTETTGLAYGMEKIPNHEMYADVVVSNQELEDSDFNLESEISMEAGEQFGVAEGNDFILGNSINKAEGFLVNAAIVAAKIAGDTAGDVSVTDILNLYYGIKDGYARNATWTMRRATVQKVVLFKDDANHYIWMPSLVGTMPQTLLGRPILECIDMPAVASLAYAVAFGDFRRGYTIVDRLQMSVLRDPYSQKMSGSVEFMVRKRVGGQVVQAEAIKILQCKTT